jgi:hypothetical protein
MRELRQLLAAFVLVTHLPCKHAVWREQARPGVPIVLTGVYLVRVSRVELLDLFVSKAVKDAALITLCRVSRVKSVTAPAPKSIAANVCHLIMARLLAYPMICGISSPYTSVNRMSRPLNLVVAEQRDDKLNRATWETLAAAPISQLRPLCLGHRFRTSRGRTLRGAVCHRYSSLI